MTTETPSNAAAVLIIITHPNDLNASDETLGPMTWLEVKAVAESHLPNTGG